MDSWNQILIGIDGIKVIEKLQIVRGIAKLEATIAEKYIAFDMAGVAIDSNNNGISLETISDIMNVLSDGITVAKPAITVIKGAAAAETATIVATGIGVLAIEAYAYSQPEFQQFVTEGMKKHTHQLIAEYDPNNLNGWEHPNNWEVPAGYENMANITFSSLFDYIYDRTKDAMANWTIDDPPAWKDTTEPSPSDDDMGEYIDLSEIMPNLSIDRCYLFFSW